MLTTDETEGCLQTTGHQRKLSVPHTAAMIDFDGDCLSDLFVTVTDALTGRNYYEIYLRREQEQGSGALTLDEDSANQTI
jgi:hypothetical protein